MLKKQMKKFQTKLRKDKKMACAAITSVLLLCSAGAIVLTHASSTITKYYNKAVTITLKDSNGYKQITKNGKKVAIKKGVKTKKVKCTAAGKYTIKTTNKKGLKKTIIVYIDKKKPVIKGVNNLGAYKGSATVAVTDNVKLDTVTVNGTKTDAKFTVSKAGSYTVVAKDMAGNKATSVFTVTNNEITSDSGVTQNSPSLVQNTIAPTILTPTLTPVVQQTGTEIPALNTKTPVETSQVTKTPIATPEPTPIITIVTPEPEKAVVCTEHQWKLSTDNNLTYPRTCTKDGLNTYTCTVCGAVKKEELKALGHKWEVNTENTASLCKPADCENAAIYYYTCSECSEISKETCVYGTPLQHNYVKEITGEEEQVVEPATCTRGAIYRLVCNNEKCPHKYSEETWQADNMKGHNYQIPSITPEPLCETKVYPYICTECLKASPSKTYEVKGTGHNWTEENRSEEHKYKDATCTYAAEYFKYCTNCHQYSSNLTYTYGDPLGHHFEARDEGKYYLKCKADCCHNTTYYFRCDRKNGNYQCTAASTDTTWEKSDKKSHTWETTKDATCQKTGLKSCTNTLSDGTKCKETEEIPIQKHIYEREEILDNKNNLINAFCEYAVYGKLCRWCNNSVETNTFTRTEGKLGHDFNKHVIEDKYCARKATYNTPAYYYPLCTRTGCTKVGSERDLYPFEDKIDTEKPDVKLSITTYYNQGYRKFYKEYTGMANGTVSLSAAKMDICVNTTDNYGIKSVRYAFERAPGAGTSYLLVDDYSGESGKETSSSLKPTYRYTWEYTEDLTTSYLTVTVTDVGDNVTSVRVPISFHAES